MRRAIASASIGVPVADACTKSASTRRLATSANVEAGGIAVSSL